MGKDLVVSSDDFKLFHDYYTVFSSDAGKEVLKDLEKELNLNSSCRNNPILPYNDPYITTFFNEGARSVYLRIINILDMIQKGELIIRKEGTDDGTSDITESDK